MLHQYYDIIVGIKFKLQDNNIYSYADYETQALATMPGWHCGFMRCQAALI